MNLIWLAPECPCPPNTGGRINVWEKFIRIALINKVYFFCIVDNESELLMEDDIASKCEEARLYLRKNKLSLYLKSFLYPYPCVSRWNTDMRADIEECCDKNNIDYIIVELPQMIGNIPKRILKTHKIIVNQQNIEYQAMQNISRMITSPVKKIAYKIVSSQLKSYERRTYLEKNIFMHTFVSKEDKEWFEAEYPGISTYLFPIGSNLNFQKDIPQTKKIIYVGKMSYEPNIAGAIWFMRYVWEKILYACPEAEFYLVGKNPVPAIYTEAEKHQHVIVTGTVDDVEKYYRDAQLVVIPLLTGGGVKVKMLEAIGHGKIVVCTTKGSEGTEFVADQDMLQSDDADGFATKCIDVLVNPEKYLKMLCAAKEKAQRIYSWDSISHNFNTMLLSKIRKNDI